VCFNISCPATKVAGQENGFKTMITEKNIFKTSEAAYAVDRNGQIVVWNQAAKQAFGYTKSEALGQHCWELLSGRDIFGNQSCCKGCPVCAAAFSNKSINRFQIDFKTATQERKKFTVSTLMLFNGPGKEAFVHLCRPESEVSESAVPKHSANRSAANYQHKPLTPRETKVLTLLHKGMTITGIADVLTISHSTVRNHTQHIFLKLRVHSRFEAVAIGRELNLI
jgi:DNA-binding CsgD family transcriptional regulator